MEKYIYIETYGCSANRNNSEILKGILTQSGYQITNNEKIADIIILNSCVVKGKTENKIVRRIQDLNSSNKLLIITGCITETNAKQIKQLSPNAILLGTHHFKDIINLITSYKQDKLTWELQDELLSERNEEKVNLPKIPDNKLISITQISEGCLGECTYCKTRLAKGKLFSYSQEDIINSIKNDLSNTAKEVWITSQDCANYGIDKENKKHKLPELLNKILELPHYFKLRLGMTDPNNVLPILEPLIEIYKNKKMYKFLHLPIQSASNKILKDMNRFYTIEQAEEIIKRFKQEIPDITISTDIITGYPTEQESDHQANIQFLQKHKPDVFNLSKFSSHKNTKAGKLKTLNPKIIHKRASELMELHRKTALENKKKFLNKKRSVFINKKLEGNLYEARDENYNIILINSDDKTILGKNIDVKIKNLGVHHMIGEIVV